MLLALGGRQQEEAVVAPMILPLASVAPGVTLECGPMTLHYLGKIELKSMVRSSRGFARAGISSG
jgi:hypothetical protein